MKHEYTLTRYNPATPTDIPASDPFAFFLHFFGIPGGTLACLQKLQLDWRGLYMVRETAKDCVASHLRHS
jgi:hypothetical protein